MSTNIPPPNSDASLANSATPRLNPLRYLTGALISGGLAIALYVLTRSIAQTFAHKPLASTNPTAINISVAVRTLVVGMSTLATAIFGIVALGLVAVTFQASIQWLKNRQASSSDT